MPHELKSTFSTEIVNYCLVKSLLADVITQLQMLI
jgi:hypothetical protein